MDPPPGDDGHVRTRGRRDRVVGHVLLIFRLQMLVAEAFHELARSAAGPEVESEEDDETGRRGCRPGQAALGLPAESRASLLRCGLRGRHDVRYPRRLAPIP